MFFLAKELNETVCTYKIQSPKNLLMMLTTISQRVISRRRKNKLTKSQQFHVTISFEKNFDQQFDDDDDEFIHREKGMEKREGSKK